VNESKSRQLATRVSCRLLKRRQLRVPFACRVRCTAQLRYGAACTRPRCDQLRSFRGRCAQRGCGRQL